MLNFSKFQKIADDGKTVTMRHEKGHEMKILIKALRPIEREQIKRLKMAEGGKIQRLKDGTPDKPLEIEAVDPNDSENQVTTPTAADQSSVSSPTPVPAPAGSALQNALATPPDAIAVPTVLNPNGTLNPTLAAQLQEQSNNLGAQIDAEAAAKKAAALTAYNNQIQKAQNDQMADAQQFKSNTDGTLDYIKGHQVNANLYGQSQTDQQKSDTAIGLFLGGLGGQGDSNMALDYLNKNIDRSIQAQRDNLESQKTVLGAYRDIYNNDTIANNLAKVTANDLMVNRVNQIANNLGTPIALQKAQQYQVQKGIENSKLFIDSTVELHNLAGYTGSSETTPAQGQSQGQPSAVGNVTLMNAKPDPDHILNANAERIYNNLKSNSRTLLPEQISAKSTDYRNAVQADKSIDQIKNSLWPELMAKRNFSQWASEKIDPHAMSAIGGAAGAGLGALGGVGVGGVGAVGGGVGGGALGAAVGEGAGLGAKGVLGWASGQEGIQYKTALDSFITQVGNALGAGITPTEKEQIAREFAPTWRDNDESANNKLEKLIKKIKSVARTGSLYDKNPDLNMLNPS